MDVKPNRSVYVPNLIPCVPLQSFKYGGVTMLNRFPWTQWRRCQIPPLLWRHNGGECVSNHQPCICLLNHLFGVDQRKHQSSASLAFVWGIHRGPVNSPHKGSVTRKMFPFDDVIMRELYGIIFVEISRICEFRVIMGKVTELFGHCLWWTLGFTANDYINKIQ